VDRALRARRLAAAPDRCRALSDPRGDRHLHVGRAGRELEFTPGYAGAVDLGPVVYHGIGAFVTAALMLKLGLPFLVSAGLAGVMAIAIAYAVGTPTLRLRGAYFAIGTLALAESTKQLALGVGPADADPLTGGSAGCRCR